ncbi:serine/threonine protein kinase [Gemmata sp. G18]|uniref:Serine/threonine protein kinase n=1 Tax=Gemmata palustris TaxID=2822762 RepID=A0ABS5BM09_9BACT|nr:serine/threonine-protein kinase [Gemmata palustris]MBP3954739.1 serine/threonine protein kinase [Gemmata palustris]
MTRNPADAGHEDRLNEVLLAYLEARQTGAEPDRAALLTAHPELRDDLGAFFASHDEVERLTAPAREFGAGAESPKPAPGSSRAVPRSALGCLGDFHLIREVGRGGMGVVYEAEQISLNRRVALKVLPFAAAVDPRQLQRFKNEATAAAHLRHENIVPVFAVGSERGVHYYAMQFVEGQSLAALIAELRRPKTDAPGAPPTGSTAPIAQFATERESGGPAYWDRVAGLGRQSALALEHAHQMGIVHRDVKPGNLLLDPRGQLWVADFGLAQVVGDSGLTATGELLGTLRYASPEQALGRRGVVDHRSDVYSLGATLYELLTLRPPFEGRDRHELLRQIADEAPAPLRSINSAVPTGLETIVLKALRKEPADRYATAQELADDLQRFIERRPILARPPSSAERFRMWARRHPSTFFVCAAVLLLVTAGSLVSAALVSAERDRTRAEHHRAEESYQRERQRAEEAEARLVLARRAVDELFRASEEELADRPGTEHLRKRLLRSALAYYQELLVELRDNSRAQAELLEATRRVETILADLAVLRAATHFYLLCQPAVLDELRLDSDQRTAMKELTARVGKQWGEWFRDVGRMPPTERGRRAISQARGNETGLNAILDHAQQVRLRQIGLQSEGPSAFRDPEVAAVLGLTLDQRERIRVIEDAATFAWARGMNRNNFESPPEVQEPSPNERILAVLTGAQAQKWREMTGSPLKEPLLPFGAPVPAAPKKGPKGHSKNAQ